MVVLERTKRPNSSAHKKLIFNSPKRLKQHQLQPRARGFQSWSGHGRNLSPSTLGYVTTAGSLHGAQLYASVCNQVAFFEGCVFMLRSAHCWRYKSWFGSRFDCRLGERCNPSSRSVLGVLVEKTDSS